MQEFLKKDFAKILKQNGLEGHRYMKESDSTCIRVYDRSLEGLDITVDLYGQFARILDYAEPPLSDEDREEAIDIVNRFLYVEKGKIIYKTRKKREGREQHEREDESLVVEVKEGGHYFKCELLKYVDTGLFLDQARTRKSVEESAFGLKVLNLFSYTGSFSIYAAAGGAESVTSVDLSNVYRSWSIENMVLNGFIDKYKYPCIAEDAYAFINRALEEKEKWDLIIFDPPSFSNSHKAEDFDLKKDYLYYLYNFTKLLSDKGVVIFSMNLGSFTLEKAKIKPYYKISELTDELRAFGFTKKKNNLRIFRLEKVKEFKGEVMRRIQDDESLEHLSLDGEKKREKKEKKEGSYKKKDDKKRFEKKSSYGLERGSFKERREDDRPRRRFDDEDRPRKRYDDERPRYSDRKEGFRTKDGKYDESWFEKQNRSYGRDEERPKRRFDDDRPRRRYDDDRPRRRFDDDDRPRKRYDDDRPRRRYEDDDRPRRRFDDDRPRRRFDDERPKREEGERKPRERKKPVPYGYDEFRSSKRDDKKN